MIIKLVVRFYQAITDFILNNSGSKVSWRNKKEGKSVDHKPGDYFLR